MEFMKIGINDIAEGFQIAFVPTADGQAHFELVNTGERKLSAIADALLREVSEEESLDVDGLFLDEYSGRLDVGNHNKIAIMAMHSEEEYGSCVLLILGVTTVVTVELVEFNSTNWAADTNAVWDAGGFFKREYNSPSGYFIIPTEAITGLQPNTMSITIKNNNGWSTWIEASSVKLWFGDYGVNANEGGFYLESEEETTLTYNISEAWGYDNLSTISVGDDFFTLGIGGFEVGGEGDGIAGIIEEIELPATDLHNVVGNFSEVRVIDTKGFSLIYPLVKELSPGNTVQIYAWPL